MPAIQWGQKSILVPGTPDQHSHMLSIFYLALLPGNQGAKAFLNGTAVNKSGTNSKSSNLTEEQEDVKKFNNDIVLNFSSGKRDI